MASPVVGQFELMSTPAPLPKLASHDLDMPLDKGIAPFVDILREGGVETYESCEGGSGHPFPEPTIRFCASGRPADGWHALSVAIEHALPVSELRKVWSYESDGPNGPFWEMVFSRKAKNKPA